MTTDENTDTKLPIEEVAVNLQTAHVSLQSATTALRETDRCGEKNRRMIVGWLDDISTELQRTGQTYQRLQERSAQRPSIAVPGNLAENGGNPDGPTVILHEQGEGPRA